MSSSERMQMQQLRSSWKKKKGWKSPPIMALFCPYLIQSHVSFCIFFQYHEQGMLVDNQWHSIKACQLSREFKYFTAKAKVMATLSWVKWHSAESNELASNFVLDARQTLTGQNKHHDCILNMDQTSTPFSCHGKWSLDSHDTFMVDIHKSTEDKNVKHLLWWSQLPVKCFHHF